VIVIVAAGKPEERHGQGQEEGRNNAWLGSHGDGLTCPGTGWVRQVVAADQWQWSPWQSLEQQSASLVQKPPGGLQAPGFRQTPRGPSCPSGSQTSSPGQSSLAQQKAAQVLPSQWFPPWQ
jgi:hypothetical protein